MKDQFVSYDVSLKLKRLGFNESCLCSYFEDGSLASEAKWINYNVSETLVSAPLPQQVIDWFEEIHKILILITLTDHSTRKVSIFKFNPIAGRSWNYDRVGIIETFESIKEANTKGIEIAINLLLPEEK